MRHKILFQQKCKFKDLVGVEKLPSHSIESFCFAHNKNSLSPFRTMASIKWFSRLFMYNLSLINDVFIVLALLLQDIGYMLELGTMWEVYIKKIIREIIFLTEF